MQEAMETSRSQSSRPESCKGGNFAAVASAMCVVENAPFGIRAARAAGCRVVALCPTLSPDDLSDADWVFGDQQELELLFAVE